MRVEQPKWVAPTPGVFPHATASTAPRVVAIVLLLLSLILAGVVFGALPYWQLSRAEAEIAEGSLQGPAADRCRYPSVVQETLLPSILPWLSHKAHSLRALSARCELELATTSAPSQARRDKIASQLAWELKKSGGSLRLLYDAGVQRIAVEEELPSEAVDWLAFQAARSLGDSDYALRIAQRQEWEDFKNQTAVGAYLCLHGRLHAGRALLEQAERGAKSEAHEAHWASAACGSRPSSLSLRPEQLLSTDSAELIGLRCVDVLPEARPLVLASSLLRHEQLQAGFFLEGPANQALCEQAIGVSELLFAPWTAARVLSPHAYPAEWVQAAAEKLEARALESFHTNMLRVACSLWVQAGHEWLVMNAVDKARQAAARSEQCATGLSNWRDSDGLASLWFAVGRPEQAAKRWKGNQSSKANEFHKVERAKLLALAQLDAGQPLEAIATINTARLDTSALQDREDFAWLELAASLRASLSDKPCSEQAGLGATQITARVCNASRGDDRERQAARSYLAEHLNSPSAEVLPAALYALGSLGGAEPEVFLDRLFPPGKSRLLRQSLLARAKAASWRGDQHAEALWHSRATALSAPIRGPRSALLAFLSGL